MNNKTRRDFLKKSALGGAALAIPFSAKSYNNIIGANDRIHLGVAGINSRGGAHIRAAGRYNEDTKVIALCDVDNRLFGKTIAKFDNLNSKDITTYGDFRKMLENKNIDAVTIASPDHWHAPMAIMAMNAGKDVYCEKPFSHNPQEGEWMIQAQKKTGKVLQIGNQQRSSPTSTQLVKDIKSGLIGKA